MTPPITGRVRSASAQPPTSSTTGSPSTSTVTAAPTSPRSAKLAANASPTPSNPAAHCPAIGALTGAVCRPARPGTELGVPCRPSRVAVPALVAQGIEHRPPEACAGVRIAPRALRSPAGTASVRLAATVEDVSGGTQGIGHPDGVAPPSPSLAGRLAASLPDAWVVALIARAHRRFEPELAHLDALLPARRRRAVDIGTWYGPWTIALASRFDAVTAVEPNAVVAERLRRALPGNATLEIFAASDTSGTAVLHAPTGVGAEGVGSLHGSGTGMASIEVETQPLDALGLTDVDFLKIDVEGHELPVLLGATATIAAGRPVVVIELEPRLAPIEPIFALMDDLGYRPHVLRGGTLDPIDPARFSVTTATPRTYLATVLRPDDPPRCNNVIFIPDDRPPT